MDRPQPVTPALERDLANLRSLNRHFGATRILEKLIIPHFQKGRTLHLIDLCTGSADLPRYLIARARARGCHLTIDAVDAHPSTLSIAAAHSSGFPELTLHQGDARTWQPVRPADLALCSLALHHFTEPDAYLILTSLRTMAPHSLLADLERSWWATAGIYAASLFYREPMTTADMRRSALAAFSFTELHRLALAAGWPPHHHHQRFFYGRQAIWFHPPS